MQGNRHVETEKISKKSTNADAQIQKTFSENGELLELQIQVRNRQSEVVAMFYTKSVESKVCEIRESWLVRKVGDHYEIVQFIKDDDKWHPLVTLRRKEGHSGKEKEFDIKYELYLFTIEEYVGHHCMYWNDVDSLKTVHSRASTSRIIAPTVGWIGPADQKPPPIDDLHQYHPVAHAALNGSYAAVEYVMSVRKEEVLNSFDSLKEEQKIVPLFFALYNGHLHFAKSLPLFHLTGDINLLHVWKNDWTLLRAAYYGGKDTLEWFMSLPGFVPLKHFHMEVQCKTPPQIRPMPELEKIYEREAKVSLQRQDSTGRIISPRGGYSPRIAYGSDPEELIRRLVLQKRVDLNQPIRIGGREITPIRLIASNPKRSHLKEFLLENGAVDT